MGGYAAYVWPAYAIALLVIGGLIVHSVRTLAARRREAAEVEAASPRRQRRRQAGPEMGETGSAPETVPETGNDP